MYFFNQNELSMSHFSVFPVPIPFSVMLNLYTAMWLHLHNPKNSGKEEVLLPRIKYKDLGCYSKYKSVTNPSLNRSLGP